MSIIKNISVLLFAFSVCVVEAAEPVGLTVLPAEFSLTGTRARQQLLVTAEFPDQTTGDLSRKAEFFSLTPTVILVSPDEIVVPRGDGVGEVLVKFGGFERRVTVTVENFGKADPVDFSTDVIAAVSRAGCNQGTCHGSPQGKNGFRLSLRGFDPSLDFVTLAREDMGRRTNLQDSAASLVMLKGTNEVPHQGGLRFRPTDSTYQVLRAWIDEGCNPSIVERKLEKLEVLPGNTRLHPDYPRQQLTARAYFSDGSVRDVTELAVFTSSDEDAATVNDTGLVEFLGTAEVTFLVRYLDRITGVRMLSVKPDPEFVFHSPPVANYVDEHVFHRQQELQLQPADVASDAVFLRRVFLDTIGTLPTGDEARAFLSSTEPDKRTKLIDQLLERDEFAYFWALKWADVMRGSDVTISNRGVHSFHRYLVKVFAEDRPFDQFARETLTSLGSTLSHPAANFHRVARTPDEAAEAMAQLFLGVRIGCAKCHNHPFEAITQDDYYGFAAFFSRVKFKGKQFGLDDEIVYLDRNGEVRHPVKNQNMPPMAFGEPVRELTPDDDRRQELADWLTRPDNKYFAPSIVNRLWYHLFGKGIVDPVDDFRETNPPSNSELLQALAADFVAQGYKIRPVLRVILNSSTYQLSSVPVEPQSKFAAKSDPYFTSATVRMLTSEQILDAITSATGVPEEFPGYPRGTRAIQIAEGTIDHHFLKAFSKPVRDVTCECGRDEDPSLSQVIHLLNNTSVTENIKLPESHLGTWLAAENLDDNAVLDRIYLTTLSRFPTSEERELVSDYIAKLGDRTDAFRDLQHALFNSNEFLLRH